MATMFVLGAGGWGLGLALAAHRAGHTVTVWSCFEKEIEELRLGAIGVPFLSR